MVIPRADVEAMRRRRQLAHGLVLTTSPAQALRAWQLRWAARRVGEFNFILLVDLGFSAPLPSSPATVTATAAAAAVRAAKAAKRAAGANATEAEAEVAAYAAASAASVSATKAARSERTGSGYSLVCVERIADELRYRTFNTARRACSEATLVYTLKAF